MKLLHISHDDKFIDSIINDFKFNDVINEYVIYVPKLDYKLKYVKSDMVKIVQQSNIELEVKVKEYDAIFIHFLTQTIAEKLILKNPNKIYLMVFWGSEIFNLSPFIKSIYQPLTKEILSSHKEIKKFKFSLRPKKLVREYNKYFSYEIHCKKLKKSLRKINFFCHWNSFDYELFKTKIAFKARRLDFIYNNMILDSENNLRENFNNILIGNSADPSNNHIDIFEKIKNFNFENKKIIVPLSYPENFENYIDEVISKGEKLFGKNFTPLREFYQPKNYNKIIKSCGFIIMNHNRSQGAGNINIGIFHGKKIFLNKNNNLKKFYSQNGIKVFSIENDLLAEDAFEHLSYEEKKKNRILIEKKFGNNSAIKMYKKIIKEINSNLNIKIN